MLILVFLAASLSMALCGFLPTAISYGPAAYGYAPPPTEVAYGYAAAPIIKAAPVYQVAKAVPVQIAYAPAPVAKAAPIAYGPAPATAYGAFTPAGPIAPVPPPPPPPPAYATASYSAYPAYRR